MICKIIRIFVKKIYCDTQHVLRKFYSFEKKFFERNAHISNFVSNQNEKKFAVMKVYDLNTSFNFGKYEGKPLEEVFRTDPAYVQQCMITVEDFAIDEKAIQKLFEKYPDSDFSDESIDANLEKLDVLDSGKDDIFIGEEGYDVEDYGDLDDMVDPLEKEDNFEDIEDDDFLSTSQEDDWDDDDDDFR